MDFPLPSRKTESEASMTWFRAVSRKTRRFPPFCPANFPLNTYFRVVFRRLRDTGGRPFLARSRLRAKISFAPAES